MNSSYNCYDTISYSDLQGRFVSDGATHSGQGRFVIDGVSETDIPGEYYRTYPWTADSVFPTRKMTLVVKDGEARVSLLGPEVTDTGAPVNNFRQPTKVVATWTYNLDALGYSGGQIGFWTYAHQATFTNVTVTDLSDDANLPTDYCNGMATCTDGGVCTAVPAADVCPDPVGATSVDLTTTGSFDYIGDPGINANCAWQVQTSSRGSFLYQSSNANTGTESTLFGCNAILKGQAYTDFIMQTSFDNYDNDGVGVVFGWVNIDDHWKAHKIIDQWPNPAADGVRGPNFKVKRRLTDRLCFGNAMDETNNCYETVAFVDKRGVFFNGMPPDTVAPWQYADKYYDYTIGRGVATSESKITLIVKNNQLRIMFNAAEIPNLNVANFVFDLSQYNYKGGKVGLFTFAHQAQWFDFQIMDLATATNPQYCANGGVCDTTVGLCM